MATTPSCPECGSSRIWKDGLRYIKNGNVQRYLCRKCGYRFSETRWNRSDGSEHVQQVHREVLCSLPSLTSNRQICASELKGAKNLAKVETRIKKRAAGATKVDDATVRGKIVEFAWWMKKQGYADETIRGNVSCLRTLANRGAYIYDPESVKDVIARQNWSPNRKRNVINAYSLFLRTKGLQWEKPKCKVTRKIPFIPTEQELDALIAGCGKKTSTFLQLLKETAMRSGEAKRILWTDVDSERRMITLNNPEKYGNPRAWKVSTKLVEMLNALPRKSQRIFGNGPINSLKTTFYKARKRLAAKLQNPRLLRISFHTFRHWKATMFYHQTKNPILTMRFLGHRKLDSTLLYIHIDETLFKESNDEFAVKATKTSKEIKSLLEVGFEYVCQKDELMFFRKRK